MDQDTDEYIVPETPPSSTNATDVRHAEGPMEVGLNSIHGYITDHTTSLLDFGYRQPVWRGELAR